MAVKKGVKCRKCMVLFSSQYLYGNGDAFDVGWIREAEQVSTLLQPKHIAAAEGTDTSDQSLLRNALVCIINSAQHSLNLYICMY